MASGWRLEVADFPLNTPSLDTQHTPLFAIPASAIVPLLTAGTTTLKPHKARQPVGCQPPQLRRTRYALTNAANSIVTGARNHHNTCCCPSLTHQLGLPRPPVIGSPVSADPSKIKVFSFIVPAHLAPITKTQGRGSGYARIDDHLTWID